MPPAASQKVLTYEVQERVLCFHGPMLYEAKVLEVKKSEDKKELPEYKVHYKGWKNTYVSSNLGFFGFRGLRICR
jgi:mortality factor 4-like protein 1